MVLTLQPSRMRFCTWISMCLGRQHAKTMRSSKARRSSKMCLIATTNESCMAYFERAMKDCLIDKKHFYQTVYFLMSNPVFAGLCAQSIQGCHDQSKIKIMMCYFLVGDKWKMFQTSQLCSNLDTWVGKWDSGETLSERSATEWTKPHRPSRLDMLMDIYQRGYVKVIPRRSCGAPSGAVWQWASWLNKELTKLRGRATYVSWVANLFWSLVLWLVA